MWLHGIVAYQGKHNARSHPKCNIVDRSSCNLAAISVSSMSVHPSSFQDCHQCKCNLDHSLPNRANLCTTVWSFLYSCTAWSQWWAQIFTLWQKDGTCNLDNGWTIHFFEGVVGGVHQSYRGQRLLLFLASILQCMVYAVAREIGSISGHPRPSDSQARIWAWQADWVVEKCKSICCSMTDDKLIV